MAVIGFQLVELVELAFQRNEQRGVNACAWLIKQGQACGSERADEGGVHIEMGKGCAATGGVNARCIFRLAHHNRTIARQARSGGKAGDTGSNHQEIDLLHQNTINPVVFRNLAA